MLVEWITKNEWRWEYLEPRLQFPNIAESGTFWVWPNKQQMNHIPSFQT